MTITMTSEFSAALEHICSGEHVLITGKAGTGKSTLLRTYLESVENKNVLVTAPTGVAALNVDGFTIHRSFGFRPGLYPDDLGPGGRWKPSGNVVSVLRSINVLVIDEISMVRADLFDMVDLALRRIRESDTLFGGVQLVLVGDLLQLPPVVTNDETALFESHWETPYFFSAECFDSLDLHNITLTTIWRQSDDEFIEVLNQVREGSVGDAALDVLNTRVDPNFLPPDDWVTLASHRRTVEKINGRRLDELPGERFTSLAEHEGETDNNSYSGADELHYAEGARVMTIINDPYGRFVNGSFGTIVSATEDKIGIHLDHSGETVEVKRHTWEIKRPTTASGVLGSENIGKVTQFPVILAWAITIHKSQGKTIPKLYIDLAGGTTTDGQFYVALSRAVTLENLRFSTPVERRHIRANNSLVRRIRRDVSPNIDAERLVFLSFDGVSFGISDHIARIHAIVVEKQAIVAEFGSWINPMSDLGDFGVTNNVPAGGLALAPTLGDFWPLLRRQAAGAIVIGDRLPMLERAVRHQEKGMDLELGVGYDAAELGLNASGSDVVARCREIVDAYQANPKQITHGQIAPAAPLDTEGAVFNPRWAPPTPMRLDPNRATESDRAWAAFSGGETENLDEEELAETAELLSAWAISRGFWNDASFEEVHDRARAAGLADVQLPEPSIAQLDIPALLKPGTRVAFTGRNNLLGGPADDERLERICAERNLEYKKAVSKSRCDVLVALDPASMSRKAQSAREFGKPIISQSDFEHWYEHGPFTGASDIAPPGKETAVTAEAPVIDAVAPATPDKPTYEWVRPEEFFTDGIRVAFRGSTYLGGQLYPHGEPLAALCDSLGLVYKQAVTKSRCDVLVTDDPDVTDGKMDLAARYGKPLMSQDEFSAWALQRFVHPKDDEEIEPVEPVKLAEPEEADIDDEDDRPASVPAEVGSLVIPIDKPRPQHRDSEPQPEREDPTPQEMLDRAMAYQRENMTASPSPMVQQQQATPLPGPKPNKAAKRLRNAGLSTAGTFVASIVFAGVGLVPVGGILMLISMVLAVVTVVFGVQALITTLRNR